METNLDDLYILVLPPEDAAIDRVPFIKNPLVVIAQKNHPLARETNIPLERLSRERFIAREPGSGTRIQVSRFFAEHGVSVNVRLEFGSNEAIKHAVAGGLGISVVSSHTIDVDPMSDKLAVLDVQGFPLIDEWFIVYPHGKRLSVVAKTFLEFLQAQTQDLRDRQTARMALAALASVAAANAQR